MNDKPQKNISRKIVFLTILIVSIVLIPIEILNFLYEQNSAVDELQERADNIEKRISANLSYPLWTYNDSEILNVINLEMMDPYLAAVRILNQNDTTYKVFYKDSSGQTKEKIQDIEADPEINSLFVKKQIELFHERKNIGSIVIYFTDLNLKKSLNSIIIKTILRLVLLILTISSSIIFALNKAMVRPINKLSEKVKEFTDSSDFSIRAEIYRKDEIGRLAGSFNQMIKELEQNSIKTNDLISEVNNKNSILQNEIKERKNAEKSLTNSELRYTTLYETMIDAFVNLDISGNILEANPAFTNMIGVNIEELRNTHISNYTKTNFFYEDSKFRQKLLDTGKSELIQTEFRNVKIGFFPVEIRAHLSTDEYKRPNGIWITVRDITERKMAENNLLQAQKMDTVGNLAGGLAHDFNNVLGGIIGTISMLKFTLNQENPIDRADLREQISFIDKAAKRSAEMVNQLLALSKRADISPVPIELNKSIQHVVNLCKTSFDKSIEIQSEYYPGDVIIKADPTQIEQVFLNLCVNASHAMTIMRPPQDRYGGTLRISINRVETDEEILKKFPYLTDKEYWMVVVSDTGVGMSRDVISKIYDPFFTTKDKEHGTGLGLSMGYNIIKKHKGFIDLDSDLDKGTTFYIILPVQTGLKVIEKTPDRDESFVPGSGTILVIDDEEMIRNVAQRILTKCGYKTIFAEDGEIGLKKFSIMKDSIDLVILDMVMPKLSGEETFEELKKIAPDIKVLMASGFKQDERVQRSLRNGVLGFIQKPYTMHQLSTKVSRVLSYKT